MIPDFLLVIMAIIIASILYIPIIILHEFGHWLVFRLFGLKPEFRINLFGDFEMGRNIHNKVNLVQTIVSVVVGIILGIFPILLYSFFLSKVMLIGVIVIYVIGIQQDLMTFQMILTAKGLSWKKATLFDVNEYHYRKYIDSVKNGGNY